jgi:AIPR protein/Restriction Enzyme Adenine Methylase Associated
MESSALSEVWDIERLYQFASLHLEPEHIKVDFKDEYGEALRCVGTGENGRYATYLAILPGTILSSIYSRYGQRLLERNVRAFLQTRGKVNKGILDTLKTEPEMFLAYNNGISTTADAAETEVDADGDVRLVRLTNLQIVNGGQTTASIHNAEVKQSVDLSEVFVQMKLTVLKDPSEEATIVPLISKYANSQTKINVSDFAANEAFHVELEKQSRRVWVPNPGGKATTKWFYERARGSYLDELGRQTTQAQKRVFKAQYPSSQKITKTLMAKYEMTWMQQPHKVSLGAEKNFAFFTSMMAERKGFVPDERYFTRLIAQAILFRRCDALVRALNVPGYKANVVTYAVAWLSFLTSQRLDLDAIWDAQDISDETAAVLSSILPVVVEHVTSPPRTGMNVTEWCKKEDCWKSLKDTEAPEAISRSSRSNVLPRAAETAAHYVANSRNGDQEMTSEGHESIRAAEAVPSASWFAMASWGRQTGYLQAFENKFLFQMGRITGGGRSPSLKQANWALTIRGKALESGFRDEERSSGVADDPKADGSRRFASRSRNDYDVTVRDLIAAGLIRPGDVVSCEPRRGELHLGTLGSDGDLTFAGRTFHSPSEAAVNLAGNSRNGWYEIKINGRRLKEYRDDFRAARSNSDAEGS